MDRSVRVVDYDSAWPAKFEELRARVLQALGSIAVAVEHVGSTAVPGLVAKPIIDIDVVVASSLDAAAAIERLAALGYRHRGNLGIKGREAFDSPRGLPAHHLYVCLQGSSALQNHLIIRDCLRRSCNAAATYGALKKRLAERYPQDIEKYVSGKSEFLLGLLREAGVSDGV
jgi:GrpB-like predicted nucleotidyltransferase (UPF0157 family)